MRDGHELSLGEGKLPGMGESPGWGEGRVASWLIHLGNRFYFNLYNTLL